MEYKYHTSKSTWDDAQKSCKMWGGNIITITSSVENDQVVKESKSRWVKFPEEVMMCLYLILLLNFREAAL